LAEITKARLDEIYERFNRREFVHPDPLEFLYSYDDPCDRELVGLIASSLAYGRVIQILRSVSEVLEKMPSPSAFLGDATPRSLARAFRGFKHRFTTVEDLVGLLLGARDVIDRFGSLEACFVSGLREEHDTVLPALSVFAGEIISGSGCSRNSLLPSPAVGSACKRLNLFLRWMVRHDEVDPGGWNLVPASKLIVPLDTHMHRICLALGFTGRRQANMRTAMEATAAFREIVPEDPTRYDFALTRFGIRDDLEPRAWLPKLRTRGRVCA
jgi:uncharacterized protein (TIGR02757 family)